MSLLVHEALNNSPLSRVEKAALGVIQLWGSKNTQDIAKIPSLQSTVHSREILPSRRTKREQNAREFLVSLVISNLFPSYEEPPTPSCTGAIHLGTRQPGAFHLRDVQPWSIGWGGSTRDVGGVFGR